MRSNQSIRTSGRPPKSPEVWLEKSEHMLEWLDQELQQMGYPPANSVGHDLYKTLLATLQAPDFETRHPGTLTRLKARWRSHKTKVKHGHASLYANLPAKVHRHLKQLAQGEPLSKTVAKLIEDGFQTEEAKRAAVKQARDEAMSKTSRAIGETREKRELMLIKQRGEILDLKAELEHADTYILSLINELDPLKKALTLNGLSTPDLDNNQKDAIAKRAFRRLETHRRNRKEHAKQERIRDKSRKSDSSNIHE